MTANVRKPRGLEIPGMTGELDGAMEVVCGTNYSSRFTALIENRAVEARVVGSDEINTRQQLLDAWPHFPENRLTDDVFPGDAVDISEEEVLTRRPYQEIVLLDNPVPLNDHDGQGTRAITPVICGLEVDCSETTRGIGRRTTARWTHPVDTLNGHRFSQNTSKQTGITYANETRSDVMPNQ